MAKQPKVYTVDDFDAMPRGTRVTDAVCETTLEKVRGGWKAISGAFYGSLYQPQTMIYTHWIINA